MSLFKLHRVESPEILKMLKDREMRLEHTINFYRIFLFIIYRIFPLTILGLADLFTISFGNLKEEFILFTVFFMACLFLFHVSTKNKKHKPFLKYITVTFDLLIIFIAIFEFLGFVTKVTTISKEEFLIFATILFITFNVLSALRIQKYIIFYSSLLAISFNTLLHIYYDSNLMVIIFTSFFVLLSGFYNLWISDYIIKSFIANIQLNKAINELRYANKEITTQRDHIEKQKSRMIDSIGYARRIQNAVLTQNDEVLRVIPDNFILYWPKDIVSGDFYWFKEVDLFTKKYKIITAVDCTGHGVPGALMSMLGISFLNEIVLEFYNELVASEILNRLREEVKRYLHQSVDTKYLQDGMDLSMVIVDYEDMTLQYAGAFNPLYIIRYNVSACEKEIEEYKGDKMPIGVYISDDKSFTNHEIKINKGDLLYMFSDGYLDQFGGAEGKKYNVNQFKEKLIGICHLSLAEQKEQLETEMKNWMGDKYDQIDDITIVGIRV